MKKVVHHTSRCPLFLWMDMIWSVSSLFTCMVPISGPGPLPFLIASNRCCSSLVSLSAIFRVNGTNVTSTVSWYSSMRFLRVFSNLLMSISFAALVCVCMSARQMSYKLHLRFSLTGLCTHNTFMLASDSMVSHFSHYKNTI